MSRRSPRSYMSRTLPEAMSGRSARVFVTGRRLATRTAASVPARATADLRGASVHGHPDVRPAGGRIELQREPPLRARDLEGEVDARALAHRLALARAGRVARHLGAVRTDHDPVACPQAVAEAARDEGRAAGVARLDGECEPRAVGPQRRAADL